MKKILWLFVSFAIVCSLTFTLAPQVQAISSSGKCGDNLTYSYSNGVLTISGTGKMNNSTYPNYSPFDNDKNIKSVVINEGVTSICTRAFYGCENLANVSLPSTIEQIDGQAFLKTDYYNNQGNWENGVLYIGNHLIEAQDDLSGNYSIKSGTITIAYMAFDNCTNLTSVVLPDSVKYIGSQAFDRCSALANVSISKNIKRIDSWAFGYMGACSKLKTIKLPATVIDIESTAFRKTGFAQNSSNWNNGMLYIGNHLVDGGDNKYCEVADGTIDIARAAFEDGSNIKIISIPKTVKHIGAYQTYNCHSLKKIYYEGSQSEWNSIVAEPNNDLNTHNIVFGQKHQHTLRIVKENEIAATCTKNGEYVNVSYCEECESEIKRDFITVSAKGHSFGNWEQIKVATCTEGGKETRTCTKCNYTETKEYDALGHKFSNPKVTKQPTCTDTGVECGKCTRCNKETTNTIKATGHSFSDWVDTKAATCTEKGVQERKCSKCNTIESRESDALGHEFDKPVVIKKPTLTQKGIEEGVCKICGEKAQAELPCVFKDEVTGIEIKTDEGVFQEGTEIKIEVIGKEHIEFEKVKTSLKEVGSEFVAYEMSAIRDNAVVQPNGTVTVSFKIPEGFGKNVAVFYISDDGISEKLESAVSEDGKSISATLSHFSSYAVVKLDSINTNTNVDDAMNKASNNFIWIIIAVVAIVIVGIGIAVVLIKKKKEKNN